MTYLAIILLSCSMLTYVVLILRAVIAVSNEGNEAAAAINHNKLPCVAIILPVRNEASNIHIVLESLSLQRFNKQYWKVVVVDDHSEDNTIELAESFVIDHQLKDQFSIIRLGVNQYGKKQAVEEALKHIEADSVAITIDADCVFDELWLETMMSIWATKNADVVIGQVYPRGKVSSFIYNFEVIESLGINGINMLMTSNQKPVVASGANLLFSKHIHPGHFHYRHSSGDDMELLIHAKDHGATFANAFKKSSVAFTNCADSLKSLINQRLRWASKRFVYNDIDVKWIGAIVLLGNLTLYFGLFLAFINSVFIVLPAIKLFADFLLCRLMSKKQGVKFSRVYFLLIELIYPIYIIFIPCISGLININWKERTVNRDGKERAGILF